MTITERQQTELAELYADFAAVGLLSDEPVYKALGLDRKQGGCS